MDINSPFLPVRTNFHVPTRGRSVKIVSLTGEPIVVNKLAKKHGKLKIVVKKFNFDEQMTIALDLLDINFELMVAHQAHKRDPIHPQPKYPQTKIPCRDRSDFQAGNWSRFANIWMIYLSKSLIFFLFCMNRYFRCT